MSTMTLIEAYLVSVLGGWLIAGTCVYAMR